MMTYILIAVIVVFILWFIGSYNGLIRARNRVREAWSDINVQLRRRHDLIPNLVETVKGYAAHEQEVLEKVIKARTEAVTAGGMAQKSDAENHLTGALRQLFALSEAYPNLRANENFLRLQAALTDVEDKIQAARRFHNSNVMHYNTKLEQFPTNIIASFGNFKREDFFQLQSPEEAALPKVQF